MIFLLLLSYVLADCDQCDTCDPIAKACIDDLSVKSICIDGNPVPPGDHNPCYVKDIDEEGNVIKAKIPNCCKLDVDCIDLMGPCQIATCDYDEGAQRGQCKVEKKVNCCSDASDCPAQPCKIASCDDTCDDVEDAFFTHSTDSGHKTAHSKRSVNFDTSCMTCQYTDKPNCCIESIDCEHAHGGPCKENAQGFCINSKCQCQPLCKEECTHATQDVDCAYLQRELDECPNPCAAIECKHGYCKIVIDENLDADNDDVLCGQDCNDHNDAISDFVWCVDNTQNADHDKFFKCGSEVNRKCGVCETGTTAVNVTDITCDPQNPPEGPCHLSRNCDCCDDSPSQERPDIGICCQADSFVEPVNPMLDCGGLPRPVCVTKPATEKTEDELCHDWGVATGQEKPCPCTNPGCDNFWQAFTGQGLCPTENCLPVETKKKRSAPQKKKRAVDQCDECQGEATTADSNCFLDCDGDHNPVCKPDTTSVIDCCQNLQSHGSDVSLNYEFVDAGVRQCCEAILREADSVSSQTPDSPFPPDGDATTYLYTKDVCNFTSTPYIPNKCECPPEGYIEFNDLPELAHQDYCDCTDQTITHDFLSICGTDKDNDCKTDCTPIRYCSAENPLDISQDTICVQDGHVPFDSQAECDCAEDDEQHDTLHGCFPDHDMDSFIDCTNCTSTCGACPPGTFAVPLGSPPILSGFYSVANSAKAKDPLARFRQHRQTKRAVEPMCTPPPQYKPCPCSQPVAEGQQCHDNPPPRLDYDKCDCCDSDPYAFPGSRFCSTKPRVCPDEDGNPSWDYNCDGYNHNKTVCEDTGTDDLSDDIIHDILHGRDRYIRGCQPQNDSSTDSTDVFDETTHLGECKLNATTQTCQTRHGFCLERKRNVGDLIKRAMGDGGLLMPAPIECNGGAIVDPEDYLPDSPPQGSCVEYIQECHTRNHIHASCTCDCDICVIVGQ